MPSPLYSLTRSGQKTRVLRSFESHIWRNGHPFQPKRTISRSLDEPCLHRCIIIPASGHGQQHRAESVLSAARMDRSLNLRSWRACPGGFPFGGSGNVLWFRYSIYKVHSGRNAPFRLIRGNKGRYRLFPVNAIIHPLKRFVKVAFVEQ